MVKTSDCRKCGAPLTHDGREGFCPKCLLGQALLEVPSLVGEEAKPSTEAGSQFGDYELLEEIARGGMGVVYKARQRSLGRIVGLKMILAGAFATREFIHRFRIEAAAAAALQHPNIVVIHEVGVHEGRHFFSMDYVEGGNLAQLVCDGPLPSGRAALYLKGIAEAVDYAHEQGILHRDLKPANILIDTQDQPRVTDFGLAKRFASDTQLGTLSPQLTVTGQMLGSPSYMPPEQATLGRGKLGRYSDVYALGAILYEMVTGRPPFRGETPLDTVRLGLETEPIAPRALNPKVPLDLETICLKCLRKEPRRRYPTARELAEDLERFLTARPIMARPASTAAKFWSWCRRRPAVAGLSAATGLLLVLIAVGSTFAAFEFKKETRKTRAALWHSYLVEAQLRSGSGQVGQRFRTLETLAKAAAILPSVELRNGAIRAMALPDLREVARFGCPTGAMVRFDDLLGGYAQFDRFGSNGYISIHNAADGRELTRLPVARTDIMFHLAPRGRFVAVGFPQTATAASCQIWAVANGEMVFETPVPLRGFAADFDTQGRAAFGQLDSRVLLYDLERRRVIASYAAGIQATSLRFSPDGRYLAVTRVSAREVVVLDLDQDGKVVARLETLGRVFSALDWSDDGSHLAVDGQQEDRSAFVQVWSWEAGQARQEHILRGHQHAITDLRFLPKSGFFVSQSYDGTTRFWSNDTGRQVLVSPLKLAMSFVGTSRLAFQASPAMHSIMEFVADREFRTFPGRRAGEPFLGLALSSDGQLLALPSADGVQLWHLPTRTPLARVPGAPIAVSFHPTDGSLIVAESHRVVRWTITGSVAGGSLSLGPPEVLRKSGPRSTKFLLSVSQDGTKLACADGTRAEVLDWRDPSQMVGLDHEALLDHVALNANGSMAVTSGGGFKVWDLTRNQVVFELPRLGQAFASFSPDNEWLVLSSLPAGGVAGGIHSIYRVGAWQLVKEVLLDHGPWPVSAFAPDGRLLALRVTPSAIRLFDPRSWSEIATLEAPTQEPFSGLAFSRDGTKLAVACDNHSAQVWDFRAIRQELAAIGLDWDQPPYLPEHITPIPAPRIVVNSRSE